MSPTLMLARERRTPGFGVALPTSGALAGAEHILAVADLTERLGYDDVWVNDHLSVSGTRFGPRAEAQDPLFFESLTTLATVGGRLRRTGLATHGFVLPLRDPRLFAKQISTIQELSGGRLTVAPGIGSSKEDYAALGVAFEQRGRRMDEHLAVLELIFSGEPPVSYEGKHVQMKDGWFFPRPRSIEFWITGDSEPGLRRVARWATGWFSSAWASLDAYRALHARLDELLTEAGRDPRSVRRASDPFVIVTRTREEAAAIVASQPRLATRPAVVLAGTAEDVRSRVAEFLDAGCEYMELRFQARDPGSHLEMIERFATEVLPAVRG